MKKVLLVTHVGFEQNIEEDLDFFAQRIERLVNDGAVMYGDIRIHPLPSGKICITQFVNIKTA